MRAGCWQAQVCPESCPKAHWLKEFFAIMVRIYLNKPETSLTVFDLAKCELVFGCHKCKNDEETKLQKFFANWISQKCLVCPSIPGVNETATESRLQQSALLSSQMWLLPLFEQQNSGHYHGDCGHHFCSSSSSTAASLPATNKRRRPARNRAGLEGVWQRRQCSPVAPRWAPVRSVA